MQLPSLALPCPAFAKCVCGGWHPQVCLPGSAKELGFISLNVSTESPIIWEGEEHLVREKEMDELPQSQG